MTSHIPFDISKNLQELKLPGEDESSMYLQSINYMDKSFGVFYDKLKEKGYLNNSIIIIYGDHEGIHKYYSTNLPDNNRRIPVIIYIPGFEGRTISKIGGQIDIMPTLEYLMGIDKETHKASVMGSNLFNNDSGSVILPTGEIIGQTDDIQHLQKAHNISDLIITGDYFGIIPKPVETPTN